VCVIIYIGRLKAKRTDNDDGTYLVHFYPNTLKATILLHKYGCSITYYIIVFYTYMYTVLRRPRYIIWSCECIYVYIYITQFTYLPIHINNIYHIHTILGYINSTFTPCHHGRSRETLRKDLCAEIFFTFKYVSTTFRGENKFCTRYTLSDKYMYRCRWAYRIIYVYIYFYYTNDP